MIRLVSIILPTYNESGNILGLIEAIDRVITYPYEVIVVDDNSPDGTSQKVSAYIHEYHRSRVRLETRKVGRGLTASIRRGIELSRGDVIVWMDADFSMPPSVINKLIRKVGDDFDVAAGSRFVRGGGTQYSGRSGESHIAIVLSTLFNRVVPILLGEKFHDYTSGFVAVRRRVLEKIPLRGFYGEYFIDFIMRAFAHRFRVVEVPYICLPRRAGRSKTGQRPVDYLWVGRHYIATVIRLLWAKCTETP